MRAHDPFASPSSTLPVVTGKRRGQKRSYVIESRGWLDAPHGGKGARAAPGKQTRLIAAATTSSKKFPEPIIRVSRVALRSKSDCELEMSRW